MGAGQQASTQELLDRTVAGERLSAAAAAALLADGEALLAVGRAAAAVRRSRVPTQQVTFALGHTLAATAPGSEADLTAAIAAAVAAGCSEVTFRAAPVAALTRVVAAAKAHTPQLRYGLAVDDTEWAAGGISTEEALSALRDAGLSFLVRDSGSQPAVGAQHAAPKPGWRDVVDVAQHLGLDAAPTIVVRADETVAERIAQLVQVRDWQTAALLSAILTTPDAQATNSPLARLARQRLRRSGRVSLPPRRGPGGGRCHHSTTSRRSPCYASSSTRRLTSAPLGATSGPK